jgi:hypothetical protein
MLNFIQSTVSQSVIVIIILGSLAKVLGYGMSVSRIWLLDSSHTGKPPFFMVQGRL